MSLGGKKAIRLAKLSTTREKKDSRKSKLAAEKEKLEREQEELRRKEEELKKKLAELPKKQAAHRLDVAIVADGVWENTGSTQVLRRNLQPVRRKRMRQEGLGRFVFLLFVLVFLLVVLWRVIPT